MKYLLLLLSLLSLNSFATDHSLGISLGSPTAISGRFTFKDSLYFAAIGDNHITLDYTYDQHKLSKLDDTILFYGLGVISRRHGGESGFGPRIFADLNHDLNPYFEIFAKGAFSVLMFDKMSNYIDMAIGARYKF